MAIIMRTRVRYRGPELLEADKASEVRGVNKAITYLKGVSVAKAPVDVGDLRGAASTQLADEAQTNPTATLVFDEPYAAVQHEDENFEHTPGQHGEPAGQAHYVSSNFTEHRDDLVAIQAGEIRAGRNRF